MRHPIQIISDGPWLLRVSIMSLILLNGLLQMTNPLGVESQFPNEIDNISFLIFSLFVGTAFLLMGGLGQGALFDWSTRIGALFNIPIIIATIALGWSDNWDLFPPENFPLSEMIFQGALLLLLLFILVTGNKSFRTTSARCLLQMA